MAPTAPRAPEADAAEPPSTARLAGALLIAAATLLAYANSFEAAFHFDDFGIIVQPDRLHDLATLWPPSGRRWLGDLTFALNWRLGGAAVAGYHAVNVAIHVATALVVAALAEVTLATPAARAGRVSPLVRAWLPLTAGLLFALHPLATQAVTYVVQRYASLATLLYALSLLLYVRARLALAADGRPSRGGLGAPAALAVGAVAAAAAAMATKEISVTLPLAAAGYDLLFLRPGRGRLLLLPLAATALLPLLDPQVGAHLATEATLPRGQYALTQLRVVATYLRLLLLPAGQNLDHDVALSTSPAEPAVLASAALLLGLGGAGAWLIRRARRGGRVEGRLVGGGIAWFFLTLSVESSVIPLRDVIFEHRVYLPMVGAAVAAAAGLLLGVERLRLPWSPRAQAATLLLVVGLPLGVATWRRNEVWRDDVSLWGDAVAKSPGKARPRQFLGTAWSDRGELDAAERELLAAVRLQPGYHDALYNLGQVYLAKRLLPQAGEAFAEAIRADPGHAMSHNNLGGVYHRLGDFDRAEAAYREALRLDPGLAAARNNLELLEQWRAAAGAGHRAPPAAQRP